MIVLLVIASGLCFPLIGQDTAPTLIVKASTTYRYVEGVNVPLTFGLGLEAGVSKRWSLSGDVSFASSDDVSLTFVDAVVKFHPFKRTSPFFLYTGPGFFNVSSANGTGMLPRPFGNDRGSSVGVFKYSFGIGASAFVKERIYLGFHLGLGAASDDDLQSPYSESGLSVGYGF